jgi:hypothetical protein
MPVSIADLGRNRRTFEMPTDYGPVRVTYRPYQMTPAREAEIARMASDARDTDDDKDVQDTEQGLTKIIAQFVEVVEAWDLVGPLSTKPDGKGETIIEAGEPIPVTKENLQYVSSYFMVTVLNAVAKDARPKAKRSDNSNAT